MLWYWLRSLLLLSPFYLLTSPAFSQDAFDSTYAGSAAAVLPGVNTAGSTVKDAVLIQGVNTAGAVRINCLANLEALINVFANLIELSAVGVCAFLLARAILKPLPAKLRLSKCMWALAIGAAGLMAPSSINWISVSSREAGLFS